MDGKLKYPVKISPYSLALVVVLLIGYGRFLWPAYSSSGDWAFPNPTRSLLFNGWLPLFNWFDLNSYTGLAFHVLIDPLMSFLRVFFHLPAVGLMTIFYFWMPIGLMSSGMWRLAKELTKDHSVAFWASLVFTVNTYILTLLIGGHLNGAVAYGTIPWIIWSLQKVTVEPSVRRAAILSLWLTLQGVYEPRYILITTIIALFWLVTLWWQRQLTRKGVFHLAVAGGFFGLLSLFWIYGALFVKGTALVSSDYTTEPWLRALSYANVLHASLLHHVWWPIHDIAAKPNLIFLFLPLISLGALFSRRWLKLSLPLWLLALVGIFLTKGANPPMGTVNIWIFLHLPGFSAFRDPAKFFSIIGFAYALLFGMGAAVVTDAVRRFGWRRATILFPLILGLAFGIGYRPLWLQKVQGTFAKQSQPIHRVNDWFAAQPDHHDWYRVLWWPMYYQYLTFDGYHSPITATGNDVLEVAPHLPGVAPWITDQKGNPPFLNYLLDAYGVRYLAVPGDTIDKTYYQHSYAFAQSQYIAKVNETGLFDQQNEVMDENRQATHLWHNPGAMGQVFTSKSIIITDAPDSTAFSALASTSPSENSLVYYDPKTSRSDGVDAVFSQARAVILNIHYDPSQLDNGYLVWPLTIPVSGNYRLLLPEKGLGLSYRIDDQPLEKTGTEDLAGQKYSVYAIRQVSAGQHQIKAVLSSLDSRSSLITSPFDAHTNWTPCSVSDVGPLATLYEESNRRYFRSQTTITSATDEIRCLQVPLPLGMGKHQLLFDQDITTDNAQAKLYLNFIHVEDYQLPLNQMKGGFQLLETTDRPFSQATLALILPAADQTTSLTVNHLRLYDLGTPDESQLILEPDPQPADYAATTLTLDDQSPERKMVTIQDPSNDLVLTLNNQYHPGWELSAADGQIITDHFSTLLKQNAWFVPAGTKGPFTLVFRPAAPIKVTAHLSLITFIVVVAVIAKRQKKYTHGT